MKQNVVNQARLYHKIILFEVFMIEKKIFEIITLFQINNYVTLFVLLKPENIKKKHYF